ncbi:UrcA family protein [Sinimarinibacterium flocculans]|uniref:UrcA family protein n=1 Tax=Sinimarinibacterium flocculans TaxID=985250 RepID=UPI00344E52A6
MSMRSLMVCLVLVFLVANQSAYGADHAKRPMSVRVALGDLDLRHPDGAAVLLRRIETAARRICGVYDRKSLGDQARHAHCVEQVVSGALDRIDDPQVAAYVASRGSKRRPTGVAAYE